MSAGSDGGDFWVFGYGSLMWRPGFAVKESVTATIHGYHRAMCVISHRYRGTPDKPGLVLGLDHGGSCRGLALRADAADADEVLAYLHHREMRGGVYRAVTLTAVLADGRGVRALAFVVRHDHQQYAGRLDQDAMAAMIRAGVGSEGAARDYLANTVGHLDRLGLVDGPLHRLLRRVDGT